MANRPIYIALAVTVDGHRDILGLWAGDPGSSRRLDSSLDGHRISIRNFLSRVDPTTGWIEDDRSERASLPVVGG